jgi:hypothetical protein
MDIIVNAFAGDITRVAAIEFGQARPRQQVAAPRHPGVMTLELSRPPEISNRGRPKSVHFRR